MKRKLFEVFEIIEDSDVIQSQVANQNTILPPDSKIHYPTFKKGLLLETPTNAPALTSALASHFRLHFHLLN